MGDVIQFGSAKERFQQKAQHLLERAGFNESIMARILGVSPVPCTPEDEADPRNPNAPSK